jgi:hypothetical protein
MRTLRPSQRGNLLTSNLVAHCPLCLAMLLYLAASGCVALDAKEPASTAGAVAELPDEKTLAGFVKTAFTTAKLSGTPEISPVRATHDTQLGNWVFCIRGRDADNQMLEYAVLIRDRSWISELRSRVSIDGCDKETYRPFEITGQQGASGKTNVNVSTQSRSRPQTRVPQ